MPTARYQLTAAAIGNKVYAVGGYDNVIYHSTVEEFDVVNNTWATKAPMPTARQTLTSGVIAGRLYAVGGTSGPIIGTVEAYDPVSNSWTTKAPMPTAREALAAAVISGRLFAVGGSDGGGPLAALEEYDPVSDTWTGRASMPTARHSLAAVAAYGRLYAIGGYDESFDHATVEEFDPATDTWAARPSMPTARQTLVAGFAQGRLYAIGGYNGAYLGTNEEATIGLRPGAGFTFTLTGQVGAVCGATAVSNTGWVSAASACASQSTFTNATGFTVSPLAVAFTVSKTMSPSNPAVGQTVTFRLVMANTGGATLQSVIGTDTLPPYLVNVTTAGPTVPVVTPATPSGSLYTWVGQNINMGPGQSFTITVTGQIGVVCADQVLNNAAYVTMAAACVGTSQTVGSSIPPATIVA
ncbi:MAG: kelch repeat-containing protein, partial [bacterium]